MILLNNDINALNYANMSKLVIINFKYKLCNNFCIKNILPPPPHETIIYGPMGMWSQYN